MPLTLSNTSYLWASLLLVPFWLWMFFKKGVCKKDMVILGGLFGLASVVIGMAYSNLDYWHPPYIFNNTLHIEDFIYGFLFGGITAEIYNFFGFKDKPSKNPKANYNFVFLFFIITFLCFEILVDILKFNSIVALIVPPILIGLIVVILRKDFAKPALLSGLTILLFTFFWQQIILFIYPSAIVDFWCLQNLSGFMILGIPIEELLFAFALGFGASCCYEFVFNYKYKKI